ncbi:SH3 domain-containing C40 family peptidase [Paenibacillus thalictri]|uniref:Hydrolase Nlp/P60 n=1 Tax=Paenibacillus thalictri TaxID=2527873 RepID=A0A4Q9DSU0_9BACL|nr:SH3 domain-containing C40 family peptidase [Paenibacillus thalictri]TBL79964.1 hydrolase Nlp/P60 [Paenibacillus thalictri]
MNKKWTAMLLLPALAFGILQGGAQTANAASTGKIVSSVSFRTQPNTGSSVMRYLKAGETVQILEQVNSYWYKVKASDGASGYVSSQAQYISVSGSSSSGGSSSSSGSTGTIVNSVSFRTQPDTGSSVIRYLKGGEKVQILEKVNNYWYKVKASDGTVGYVSSQSQYITVGGSSSGGSGSSGNSGSGTTSSAAAKVIAAGKKYLGTPYEYGSDRSNTKTFDCSDFVRQAFKDALGITLPSSSRTQADYVKGKGNTTTNWRDLKPGDIMFFMDYKGTAASNYTGINKSKQTISHCGIYLGNGQILHTYSKESGGVKIDSIAGKHWEYRFVFGGSAL